MLNKIRPFLSPQIQGVFCQRSKLDMRAVIEHRRILLCDLSSGDLGESESSIAGALLFGKLFWTAMALKRGNPMHYVFYDEAEATNALMAAALSQARKHFLVLTLANQYTSQYEKAVLDSLSANASNKIVFRVSADDAAKLAREFPHIQEHHLTELHSFEAYVKSIARGKTTAYKIKTLPPFGAVYSPLKARILRESRARYGTAQSTIDAHIRRARYRQDMQATLTWSVIAIMLLPLIAPGVREVSSLFPKPLLTPTRPFWIFTVPGIILFRTIQSL